MEVRPQRTAGGDRKRNQEVGEAARRQTHGTSGVVGGAVADGFFGEEGLLAEATGDFGEFALVGTDGGQVIGLADEIEGAEGFPDLFVTGVHRSDLAPGHHGRSRGYGDGADAPAD